MTISNNGEISKNDSRKNAVFMRTSAECQIKRQCMPTTNPAFEIFEKLIGKWG
jgi:hypothetical protein